MNRRMLTTPVLGLIALCIIAITGRDTLPTLVGRAEAADVKMIPASIPVFVAQESPLPNPEVEDGVGTGPDEEATAVGPVLVLLRQDRIDGSPGSGEVWRWEDGKLTFLADWNSLIVPVLSPDETQMAVVDNRGPALSIVDTQTGSRRLHLGARDLAPVLTDHNIRLPDEETLGPLLWTPEGNGIIFATMSQIPRPPPGKDDLHYLSVETGEMRTLFEPGAAGALYPSPSGEHLAIVNPTELRLLNMSTLEIVNRMSYPAVQRHAGMNVFPHYPHVFWHDSSERLVLAVPESDHGSPSIETIAIAPEINVQLYEIYTSGAPTEEVVRFTVSQNFYLESIDTLILARSYGQVEEENDVVWVEANWVFDMTDHSLQQLETEDIDDAWRTAFELERAQLKILVEQEGRATVLMAGVEDRLDTLFGFHGDVVYTLELEENSGWYHPPRRTPFAPAATDPGMPATPSQPESPLSAQADESDVSQLEIGSIVGDTVEAIYYWTHSYEHDEVWRLPIHELWMWRASTQERLAQFLGEPVFHTTPAGTRVAFVDSGGIYFYDSSTQKIQELLSADHLQTLRTDELSQLFPVGLNWYPDGTKLWFSTTVDPSQSGGDTEALYEIDLETTEIRQQLLPGEGGNLLLSPAGDYLALTGMDHVRIVRISDHETVNLLEFPIIRDFPPSPQVYHVEPIWSPDGTFLSVMIPPSQDGVFDLEDWNTTFSIWQISIDGAPPEKIASYPGLSGKFSPNLDALVYTDFELDSDLEHLQTFNYLARIDGSVQELPASGGGFSYYYWLNGNYIISVVDTGDEPAQVLDVRNMQSVLWPAALHRHRRNTLVLGLEFEPYGIWLNQTNKLVASYSQQIDKYGVWVVDPDYEVWGIDRHDAHLLVEAPSLPIDFRVIFRMGKEID